MKLFEKIFGKKTEATMETTEYISLQETAELEYRAAEQRVTRAWAALNDFVTQHKVMVGRREAEMRAEVVNDLAYQRYQLEVEIDEAFRLWQEALKNLKQFQPAASCISSGALIRS